MVDDGFSPCVGQVLVVMGAMMGAWRESGLGAPDDVDRLHRRVTELEQHTAEQLRQLSERDDELDAARAAHRELMTRLNRPHPDGCKH